MNIRVLSATNETRRCLSIIFNDGEDVLDTVTNSTQDYDLDLMQYRNTTTNWFNVMLGGFYLNDVAMQVEDVVSDLMTFTSGDTVEYVPLDDSGLTNWDQSSD